MVFHIMVELIPCQIESLHRFGNGVVFGLFGSYETFGNVHMLLGVVYHDAEFLFGNGIDHNWVLNTKGDIHQVCATLAPNTTPLPKRWNDLI